MRTTKRISSISPSLTLAITAKAKAMKAEGKSVIGFGAGEPDFNTPQHIIDAAKDALDKGYTKYTPSSGLPALRKRIAEKLKEEQGLEYEQSQIIVSSGAKHSIFNAMFALIEEGDEVIIPAPYWLTYPELVKVCGGKSVFVEGRKENHFKMDPADLKAAITPKTKMLVFNSPSNPTGAVYTEAEIRAIAKVAEEGAFRRNLFQTHLRRGKALLHRPRERLHEGSHGARGRRFQDVCHDRLAHRLARRPAGRCKGDRLFPEPRDEQPDEYFAVRDARRAGRQRG